MPYTENFTVNLKLQDERAYASHLHGYNTNANKLNKELNKDAKPLSKSAVTAFVNTESN